MRASNLQVLLLGWDEVHHQFPPVAAPLGLARHLAPHTQLTVVVPHLAAHTAPIAGAEVTGLGNVPVDQLQEAVEQARVAAPHRAAWNVPAAPYLGATPEPAAASVTTAPAPAPAQPSATLLPTTNEDSLGEPEAGEANDLDQGAAPEESAPLASADASFRSMLPPSAERTTPAHSLAVLSPDHSPEAALNFRVIQYARFATPLVSQKAFEVIYAADWPTWLAAMEIRQLTNRPLVLHVHTLAADRHTADDRGWVQELERLALRRADLVLVDSEALAHRIHTQYRLPMRRLRVHSSSMSPEVLADSIRAVLDEAALARA